MNLIISILFPLFVNASNPAFEKSQIQVGPHTITVELAKTQKQIRYGLMERTELKGIDGMLFVFSYAKTRTFWMKNTYIPLSIGFFDGKGVLVDIQQMTPVKSSVEKNIPQYQSRKPAQYALEVPKGWFKKHKVKLGAMLVLPTKTKVQSAPKPGTGK